MIIMYNSCKIAQIQKKMFKHILSFSYASLIELYLVVLGIIIQNIRWIGLFYHTKNGCPKSFKNQHVKNGPTDFLITTIDNTLL